METNTSFVKERKKYSFFENPIMRKFAKATGDCEDYITYIGVAKKSGFFILMMISGVLLSFITYKVTQSLGKEYSVVMLVLGATALIACLIAPFIPIFIKKARVTAVAGSFFV